MRPVTFALLALTALPLRAAAQDLDPKKAALIEHDQQKAYDEIDKKHGNKKPSELSSDERREIIHERAAAEQAVFDKQQVSPKDYTQYTAKMGLDDRAEMKDAAKQLKEKDEAAAQKKEEPQKEIPIQHGFNDANPVVMDEKAGAPPMVEHGLPQDAADDQAAAQGLTDSSAEKRPAEPPHKAKGGKAGKRGKR